MSATTKTINVIQAKRMFYTHIVEHVISTPSQLRVRYPLAESAVSPRIDLGSIDILLRELEPGYKVLRPIPIHVEGVQGNYVAGLETANVFASARHWLDAVANLRSLILDIYDSLVEENPNTLGVGPKRQLIALSRYVQKDNSK